MFEVKYLDWQHKVKAMKVQALTEKQAEKTASSSADVKCILNIEWETAD